MYCLHNFNRELATDNPTFERFMRSDLHKLVEMLRQVPETWTTEMLAAEIKSIPPGKWVKYARTRAYLEWEIPGLSMLLRAVPVNFTTTSMRSELADTILRHNFKFSSDTGDLQDFGVAVTRESVRWNQWPASLVACIGLPHGDAYTRPGHHSGLGGRLASLGTGDDGHALMGPFNQAVLNYTGAPAQAQMRQVYEYSYDNVNWLPIPGSSYSIVREVTAVGAGRVRISITKTNMTSPGDRFMVQKTF